jgi:hypothetical protein
MVMVYNNILFAWVNGSDGARTGLFAHRVRALSFMTSDSDSKKRFLCKMHIFAGILKRCMWARNRVGIGLSYRPARLYKAGGSNSLKSIPVLLKKF